MKSALIIGSGYLGGHVATLLLARGYRVFGTTRSPERAAQLASRGIEPVVADVLDSASLERLPAVGVVLHCVGYDRAAGTSLRTVYVDGLRHVLDRLDGRIGRFVQASSTGVYGQTDGEWVDETSPTHPRSPSGQVVREAEEVVETFRRERGLDSVILRYSGLYGVGRLPRRARLESGEPIPGDPEHWLNLIEIRDAAACALAALEHPEPPSRVYNATDDRPITRGDFDALVAAHLSLPPPRYVPPVPGSPRADRETSNKRVSNRRIRAELGVEFRFPDAHAGVPAVLAAAPLD